VRNELSEDRPATIGGMTTAPPIALPWSTFPAGFRPGTKLEVYAMKIHRWIMPVVAVAALATAPTMARAQSSDDVQQAIARTDERIELAQNLVADAENAQAELELNAAIGLQGQAKTEFAALRYRIALDLTMRARGRADRAIAIVRGPAPDRVLAQLERTRELLDRIRDRIEECDNDRARALLRVAIEMQGRAEAAARDQRFLAALQLTLSARERALRALRLCNMEDNVEEAAERALNRTDELISRARDLVADSGSEAARLALGRAIDLQAEAWAQFRARHFEASFRTTQSARTFAHRAIRLARGRS
jgi:hypothetical protein